MDVTQEKEQWAKATAVSALWNFFVSELERRDLRGGWDGGRVRVGDGGLGKGVGMEGG